MSASALPGPRIPVVDQNGLINAAWYRYFVGLEKNASDAVSGEIVTAAGSGLAGGGIVSAGLTLSIGTGAVTDTMLRNSLATSVIGRFQDSAGAPADIQALADNRVLIRDGGQLVFKDFSSIPATVADADYGDITVSGTGTVFTIDANVVSNAKFRQSAGLSVVARSAATTGNVADVSGTASQFLGINAAGTALAFQTLAGDATLSGPTLTLATVNANTGAWGSATQVPQITLDAKGRATAAANVTIAIPSTQITDFTEAAQDAIGAMVDTSLVYVDATPLLTRAALTGDVTASQGSNATTIAAGAVTLAKMASMATASVFYRKTAGSGAPEVQTLATLKTDLGLTGTNSGDQTITLTGNVTGSGTGSFATTIAAGVVTLAMQANMATASVVYRKTAGAGAPEVQTLATLKSDLGLTGTNSGDQTITLTGDATGSGTGSFAVTVVKINGVALSGLATGILKNTTTTGAPSIAVAGDFPTLNQNTTGSAATLTTSRNIAGNAFNGSADISINDTDLSGAAWTAYTPTISADSGAYTTVSATGRSKTIGKTVHVQIVVTITNAGTAVGLYSSLPATASAFPFVLMGRETAATGSVVQGNILASGSVCRITKYDDTAINASGRTIVLSGIYEKA